MNQKPKGNILTFVTRAVELSLTVLRSL